MFQLKQSLLRILTGCFASVWAVNASAQPFNYTDDFESGALNPFWSISASGGSVVFPSSAQAHSGNQSVQFSSLTDVSKSVFLQHTLTPSYGQVSVWLYDTGAELASANYMGLFLGSMYIQTFDYDLGANNGGHYYYQIGNAPIVASPIDRTVGWHQFYFDATASALTISIDNTPIYSGAGGTPITGLQIGEYGPAFRPAWTSYFDDFSASLTPVPEPSTIALICLGISGVWIMRRRKSE